MGRTLDEVLAELPEDERLAIEAETHALIAEEMSLRAIRKQMGLTQVELAKELGVNQEEVSRVERRADVLVSTLRRVVAGLGGRLELVAKFPDRNVQITNIGDVMPDK